MFGWGICESFGGPKNGKEFANRTKVNSVGCGKRLQLGELAPESVSPNVTTAVFNHPSNQTGLKKFAGGREPSAAVNRKRLGTVSCPGRTGRGD